VLFSDHHRHEVYPHTHQVLPKLHRHRSRDENEEEEEEEEIAEKVSAPTEIAVDEHGAKKKRPRKLSDSVHQMPTIQDESLKLDEALKEEDEEEKDAESEKEKEAAPEEPRPSFSLGPVDETSDEEHHYRRTVGGGAVPKGILNRDASLASQIDGMDGFFRSDDETRRVAFTVVGETSHADDDDHHRHHVTDPDKRTKKKIKKK
jgi:hypothetical protein